MGLSRRVIELRRFIRTICLQLCDVSIQAIRECAGCYKYASDYGMDVLIAVDSFLHCQPHHSVRAHLAHQRLRVLPLITTQVRQCT